MNEIGKQIRKIRKKKGLSQEELANYSKLNLRTIQRIENNESEPQGKTLRLICEVLEINIEDILNYHKQENKKVLIYFHISVLAFFFIPFGNIIIPLILWIIKKDKILDLKEIGINLLNFQIIWTFFVKFCIMCFAFFKIIHAFYPYLFIFLAISLCILNVVLPIVYAYKTSKGKTKDLYPNIIRIIK